jgi:hypothetical protein
MFNRLRVLILLALVVFISPLEQSASLAQNGDSRYFPETGHSVQGDFLVAYEKAVDPVKVYGYPITPAYYHPSTGRLIQYFQRAHFELHPENPPELKVHRTLLGEIIYIPGPSLDIPSDNPACLQIYETRQSICYAFRDFFLEYGGISQFGYPISGIELYNGRLVQYFQRARFEWRPELPSGQRVALADLGRLYFDTSTENPEIQLPKLDNHSPQSILTLRARAFVSSSVMPLEGEQTLFVVVQDQNLLPVSHAQVVIVVEYPSGKQNRIILPITNESGFSKVSFSVDETEYGNVQIFVEVTSGKLQQKTLTSFRLWY